MGLHPIPWAAVRSAKLAHDLVQVAKVIALQRRDRGLRRYQQAGPVIEVIAAIQSKQRNGDRLAFALKQPDPPLLRISLHQPQLDLRRQLPAVQLANQAVFPGRRSELVPLRRRHKSRFAPGQRQQRALGGRSGYDLHGHPHALHHGGDAPIPYV